MAILLPGGAGYIGSHTAVELLKQENAFMKVNNVEIPFNLDQEGLEIWMSFMRIQLRLRRN